MSFAGAHEAEAGFSHWQVSVDVPDVKGREEILKVHARNKKLLPDVELEQVAMRTPGFSGADLANLLNEAAILTGRRNLQGISNKVRRPSSHLLQHQGGGCCACEGCKPVARKVDQALGGHSLTYYRCREHVIHD